MMTKLASMRRPRISLKKCFYFMCLFGFLIVGFHSITWIVWKGKSLEFNLIQQQQSIQKLHANGAANSANIEVENNIEKSRIEQYNNHTEEEKRDDPQQRQENGKNSNAEKKSLKTVLSSNKQPTPKPWFFKNGEYYPKPFPASTAQKRKDHQGAKLFPYQDPLSDRIVNQLMYVPHDYEQIRAKGKLKSILIFGNWDVKQGRDVFLHSKCPVDTCEITENVNNIDTADMLLYEFNEPIIERPTMNSRQVTMIYCLESPHFSQSLDMDGGVNWTSTYRRDSDIVAPYEKWVYYDPKIRQIDQDRNYAKNKTKLVAWFVSNCKSRNGRRQYARKLSKYIDVDTYGFCGDLKCSKGNRTKCFQMLKQDYKFYLAFENSNCKDYITEKFFQNALNWTILPIVMGARPKDYELIAPHRSYIHVDEFDSPKELAKYLHKLDKDDNLYNSYFKWKGTGEFINTYFWCRVCAVLHDEDALRKSRWYSNDWWDGVGICTK